MIQIENISSEDQKRLKTACNRLLKRQFIHREGYINDFSLLSGYSDYVQYLMDALGYKLIVLPYMIGIIPDSEILFIPNKGSLYIKFLLILRFIYQQGLESGNVNGDYHVATNQIDFMNIALDNSVQDCVKTEGAFNTFLSRAKKNGLIINDQKIQDEFENSSILYFEITKAIEYVVSIQALKEYNDGEQQIENETEEETEITTE